MVPETKAPITSTSRVTRSRIPKQQKDIGVTSAETKNHSRRNLAVASFLYLFFFSGIEFTLTFLTFDRFNFTNMEQGKMLGSIGILSSLIQGGYVRRMAYKVGEKTIVLQGIMACCLGSALFGITGTFLDVGYSEYSFIAACIGFSIASATVVNCMTSLYSLLPDKEGQIRDEEQGEHLGTFRSYGQLGRSFGPLIFCALYWGLGSITSYLLGSVGILLAGIIVSVGVVSPPINKVKTN